MKSTFHTTSRSPALATPRRRRRPWPLRIVRWMFRSVSDMILFILYTVFFVVLLAAFSYWLVVRYVKWGEEIAAPDLTSLTVAQALDVVAEHRLALERDRLQPSASVPAGLIVSQSPPPGHTIKERSPIRVVVSQGMPLVPVPNTLVGETRRAAGLRLRGAGLEEGNLATLAVTGGDGGIVLATDPPPGVGVPEGAKVNLLVSSGEITAIGKMPNLIGLGLVEAQDLLAAEGLTAESRAEPRVGVMPDMIHRQFPAPGERINDRSSVVIYYAPREEVPAEPAVRLPPAVPRPGDAAVPLPADPPELPGAPPPAEPVAPPAA